MKATMLLDGLRFAESPRHGPDGRLYVSDFYDHVVLAIDLVSGEREQVCEVPGQPSGLGWLPDGRLLVVSMTDRKVLRREPDGTLVEHADLSGVATFHANDMVVDSAGRAYVGNFGFDLHARYLSSVLRTVLPGLRSPGADLALVEPDGSVRVVAHELAFPNGMVLLGDTLVVAETLARQLTAFDVLPDGGLANRRRFARFLAAAPDGICADAAGGVWVASAVLPFAYRVAGGRVTDRVRTSRPCFAVALSGRKLVCCTALSSLPRVVANARRGRLEVAEVTIPGQQRS